MKKGPLSAEPAPPLQGRSRDGRSHGRGSAARDTPSAIRLLGTDNSSGTKCQSMGDSPRPDLTLAGGASGEHPLELRAGLRMESIDDDWDIEQPATTAVPAVSHAPASSSAESQSSANPASPGASAASQSTDPGQSGSPLGLAFPAVSKPATVPPSEAAQKSNPSVVPAQKATPAAVSKVQLAAEAFRRKAGISATPSTAPAAKPGASAAIKIAAEKVAANPAAVAKQDAPLPAPVEVVKPITPAPAKVAPTPAFPNVVSPTASTLVDAPTAVPPAVTEAPVVEAKPPEAASAAESVQSNVVVSPVVELEEPLELLQEIAPSVPPPPLPDEALAQAVTAPIPAAEPVPAPEPKADAPKAEDKIAEAVAPAVANVTPAAAPKPETPTAAAQTAETPSVLSLDTDYALEFFSSPPPPVHVETPIEHDYVMVEQHRERTPELVARQQYLRGLVIKVMLIAIVFVAGVIFVLWQRGLLHFTSSR